MANRIGVLGQELPRDPVRLILTLALLVLDDIGYDPIDSSGSLGYCINLD